MPAHHKVLVGSAPEPSKACSRPPHTTALGCKRPSLAVAPSAQVRPPRPGQAQAPSGAGALSRPRDCIPARLLALRLHFETHFRRLLRLRLRSSLGKGSAPQCDFRRNARFCRRQRDLLLRAAVRQSVPVAHRWPRHPQRRANLHQLHVRIPKLLCQLHNRRRPYLPVELLSSNLGNCRVHSYCKPASPANSLKREPRCVQVWSGSRGAPASKQSDFTYRIGELAAPLTTPDHGHRLSPSLASNPGMTSPEATGCKGARSLHGATALLGLRIKKGSWMRVPGVG